MNTDKENVDKGISEVSKCVREQVSPAFSAFQKQSSRSWKDLRRNALEQSDASFDYLFGVEDIKPTKRTLWQQFIALFERRVKS